MRTFHRHVATTIGFCAISLVATTSAVADFLAEDFAIIGAEHTDILAGYDNGEWEAEIELHDLEIAYAPNEALLYLAPSSATTQPLGPEWDFIGAGAGNTIYLAPEVQDPELIWLGFGAEELASGIFVDDTVQVVLDAIRGPGEISVWRNDPFGDPIPLWSSSDPGATIDVNSVAVFAGVAEGHANFAFTEMGFYEVDIRLTGTLVDGGLFIQSQPVTLYFGVGTTAVPEASSLSLVGVALAVGGGALWRRRRRGKLVSA